jgi:hypothetical protein
LAGGFFTGKQQEFLMKTFQDKNGRTWTITINVGAMKRVRVLCGVDLFNIVELDDKQNPKTDLLDRLSSDPILLVDVIYAVCKDEADKNNISDEAFGCAMSGDSIDAATDALLDEIVDFFPTAKRRVFQNLLSATRRFKAATEKQLNALLADGMMEGKITEALEISFGRATGTQASSESVRTDTPSAN